MYPETLLDKASAVLASAKAHGIRLAVAETVTGGTLSGCLTAVSGASQIFERGFVLYHDSAKATGVGVPETISREHGAVSAEVTKALAEGALQHSTAGATAAVTGYAGPGGGNAKNPVGTVFIAVAMPGHETLVERHVFSGDRHAVRLAAIDATLDLLLRRLE